MTPEPRQWYKNSERPVTLSDLPVWIHWAYSSVSQLWVSIPVKVGRGVEDFEWTHAEKPPEPPKPKEKSQAEQDVEAIRECLRSDFPKLIWHSTGIEALRHVAAQIRADQEAKTTEKYKAILQRAEDLALEAVNHVARANYAEREGEAKAWIRDFFAQPTTPTKGTP